MNLDPSQSAAVMAATQSGNRLHIITGAAGTGKTTVIRNIADAMLRKCVLCAPTGKAAARIREACVYPACTVHRELLYDGAGFRREASFNAPVIVDEASMLDSALLAALIGYAPPKLILVGDVDQLPPVGTGQPFHDLVRAERNVSRLTINHRAKEAIHEAAELVRAGRCPPRRAQTGAEAWAMIETGAAEPTTAKMVEWAKAGTYDPEQDVILSPRYGEEENNDAGIDALNLAVRKAVNPPVSRAKFNHGDRVLCCKNFGPDDLWNGDTGTVVDLVKDDLPRVRLDRDKANPRDFTAEMVRESRLGYAMSVHKAQGSQFRNVFFVCLMAHRRMLSRALIYTAVTRARTGCCVMGQLRAFEAGLWTVASKRTVLQSILGIETRDTAADEGDIGL